MSSSKLKQHHRAILQAVSTLQGSATADRISASIDWVRNSGWRGTQAQVSKALGFLLTEGYLYRTVAGVYQLKAKAEGVLS